MADLTVNTRGSRKFVFDEFWSDHGFHKSMIFGYAHGFVVILYVEQLLRILGALRVQEHIIWRLSAKVS